MYLNFTSNTLHRICKIKYVIKMYDSKGLFCQLDVIIFIVLINTKTQTHTHDCMEVSSMNHKETAFNNKELPNFLNDLTQFRQKQIFN